MAWKNLNFAEDLHPLNELSFIRPQCIFKHSTRCSISSVVYTRLNQYIEQLIAQTDMYYLDLIRYRSLSNQIAEMYHVHHESPQVLIIRNGECIFEESHMDIRPEEILIQTQ